MATFLVHVRIALAAIAVLMLAAALPAAAQQSDQVNPTASSVKEDQLLNQMRIISGRGTIPDTRSYNIEQPAGRVWRQFHEVTLHWIGAIAIVGMLVILVLFYLIRGMVRIENGRSGRTVVRFNAFERFIHWMTATCFVILALTGLNVTFGKELVLPYVAPETFTEISQWAKYTHDYVSFPFTLGVIIIFLMWIAWNLPSSTDIAWLKAGGGIVGKQHPPAGRFNAGQKGIYWIVVLGGTAMAASGYLLMFPFYVTDITGMQIAQVVHGVVAVLFVAAMLAHIYIGTIGMQGAFEAMGEGDVDLNWAKQHHSLWVEKQLAKGRDASPPPQAAATPAE
jgi:formate dehydrogenase subunit gamma